MKTNTKAILMVVALVLILLMHGVYNLNNFYNPTPQCATTGFSIIQAENYIYILDFILAGIIIILLISIIKDSRKENGRH